MYDLSSNQSASKVVKQGEHHLTQLRVIVHHVNVCQAVIPMLVLSQTKVNICLCLKTDLIKRMISMEWDLSLATLRSIHQGNPSDAYWSHGKSQWL